MKKRQVNRDMREKIFKYFHHIHKEEMRNIQSVNSMISALPETIKANFMVDLYYKLIKSHPFFEENFTEFFILQICLLVKEKKIGPEINLMEID